MADTLGDPASSADLDDLRRELRDLGAAHRALERRLERARTATLRAATVAAAICLLLGFVLPAFDDDSAAGSDDGPSPGRLVQMPFYAFGPSAPGQTSDGKVLNVVMGIGFTGLLIVAIVVIIALLASLDGIRAGAWRRIARAATVLLIIGTCVVLLLGAVGSSTGGAVHWATLVVLAVGGVLAGLLLLTGVRSVTGGAVR
jgi:hypothetical protein